MSSFENLRIVDNFYQTSLYFPPLPVDYGYRDSKNFWFHRKTRMRVELLQVRQASIESVRYAADRVDDKVKFTDEALKTVLGVPRVFLPVVLKGCVAWTKENGVELITEEHMKIINDKRAKEKTRNNKHKDHNAKKPPEAVFCCYRL